MFWIIFIAFMLSVGLISWKINSVTEDVLSEIREIKDKLDEVFPERDDY